MYRREFLKYIELLAGVCLLNLSRDDIDKLIEHITKKSKDKKYMTAASYIIYIDN